MIPEFFSEFSFVHEVASLFICIGNGINLGEGRKKNVNVVEVYGGQENLGVTAIGRQKSEKSVREYFSRYERRCVLFIHIGFQRGGREAKLGKDILQLDIFIKYKLANFFKEFLLYLLLVC